MNISLRDIAQAIGAASETFSRLMKRMQSEGNLTMKKNRIVVGEWGSGRMLPYRLWLGDTSMVNVAVIPPLSAGAPTTKD